MASGYVHISSYSEQSRVNNREGCDLWKKKTGLRVICLSNARAAYTIMNNINIELMAHEDPKSGRISCDSCAFRQ